MKSFAPIGDEIATRSLVGSHGGKIGETAWPFVADESDFVAASREPGHHDLMDGEKRFRGSLVVLALRRHQPWIGSLRRRDTAGQWLPLAPPAGGVWARLLAMALLVPFCSISCSPYPYSDSSTTLGTHIDKLAASYDAAARRIRAEQHATRRLSWLATRPDLTFGSGCQPTGNPAVSCELIEISDLSKAGAAVLDPIASGSPATSVVMPAKDNCPSEAGRKAPTKQTVERLAPLQRAEVLDALSRYGAALVALTRAQDRADFDAAASKVSAAISALVQSAAVASGEGAAAAPAAGAITKASTDVLLWIVGQSLDWQRLQELRRATAAACKPVHLLATAVRFMLEEQRNIELRTLREQLVLQLQAAEELRASKTSDQAYGDALDRAFISADAFQAARMTDPHAVAQSLQDAHDELVVAVRDDTGQFEALVVSLSAFAKNVDQLETAARTASAPSPSQSTTSK